jgi:CHAT domain-containing protein
MRIPFERHGQVPRGIGLALALAVGLAASAPAWAQLGTKEGLEQDLSQGADAFARGWLDDAILYWTGALGAAEKLGDTAGQIDILGRRAEAYRTLGYLNRSLTDLKGAIGIAEAQGAEGAVALLRSGLGTAYMLSGEREAARAEFDAALAYAAATNDTSLEARVLNDFGNLLFQQDQFAEAVQLYKRSHALAGTSSDPGLQWTATVNAAYAEVGAGNFSIAERLAREALAGADRLPETSATVNGLVSISVMLIKIEDAALQSRPASRALAYAALERATRLAERIRDERGRAYALGYMAQLYEREGRFEEALRLTRQALFAVQRLNAPEALYLWQWQVGRLQWAMGDLERATVAYESAVATLRSIRSDMIVGSGGGQISFRDSVQPVILGLADLLLRRSARITDPAKQQETLVEARRTVELLKAAQLEDYFRDNCVAALQAKVREIDRIAPRTAVLYPIILPERTELLLSLPDGLVRFTVPVAEDTIGTSIRDLRRKLEKRTTLQYLAPARRLYTWLIGPIEERLAAYEVTTLVIIPSGALTTVPFAALHDGERHLVEKFAVAVAPGLTLVEPRPIERETAAVLSAGLTKSVQGFPPLPFVDAELREVRGLFQGTLLQDQGFKMQRLQGELETTPYSIVHIASHAEFGRDARQSFLLTFDGRLTMDGLERFIKLARFREEPIELLTLSACSTAAGDERAALGLAGVGIKAGARTALASLWFVNDESASRLVSGFYRELTDRQVSKAEALRQIQLSMLAERKFRHPAYWAPFQIIGNWL